jgi:hypothetical protein
MIGEKTLGTVGHHTVTATTTKIAPGLYYTQTSCTCERAAPMSGSLKAGELWSREHLAAIVLHPERV